MSGYEAIDMRTKARVLSAAGKQEDFLALSMKSRKSGGVLDSDWRNKDEITVDQHTLWADETFKVFFLL